MVGFLLKCLFVIALVYFAVNKGSLGLSGAPAQQEVRTSAEHRAASAKTEPLTALQRAATAKLAGAAREHCLSSPGDCLAILKAVGAQAAKSDGK
jgi:hypothetical protein